MSGNFEFIISIVNRHALHGYQCAWVKSTFMFTTMDRRYWRYKFADLDDTELKLQQ